MSNCWNAAFKSKQRNSRYKLWFLYIFSNISMLPAIDVTFEFFTFCHWLHFLWLFLLFFSLGLETYLKKYPINYGIGSRHLSNLLCIRCSKENSFTNSFKINPYVILFCVHCTTIMCLNGFFKIIAKSVISVLFVCPIITQKPLQTNFPQILIGKLGRTTGTVFALFRFLVESFYFKM